MALLDYQHMIRITYVYFLKRITDPIYFILFYFVNVIILDNLMYGGDGYSFTVGGNQHKATQFGKSEGRTLGLTTVIDLCSKYVLVQAMVLNIDLDNNNFICIWRACTVTFRRIFCVSVNRTIKISVFL